MDKQLPDAPFKRHLKENQFEKLPDEFRQIVKIIHTSSMFCATSMLPVLHDCNRSTNTEYISWNNDTDRILNRRTNTSANVRINLTDTTQDAASLHRAYPSLHPFLWGSTLGTRATEHKGCNWGMQIDWWLQPRAVFGHTFSGIIWQNATGIKSIQLHDSIVMASPWDSISYIQFLLSRKDALWRKLRSDLLLLLFLLELMRLQAIQQTSQLQDFAYCQPRIWKLSHSPHIIPVFGSLSLILNSILNKSSQLENTLDLLCRCQPHSVNPRPSYIIRKETGEHTTASVWCATLDAASSSIFWSATGIKNKQRKSIEQGRSILFILILCSASCAIEKTGGSEHCICAWHTYENGGVWTSKIKNFGGNKCSCYRV